MSQINVVSAMFSPLPATVCPRLSRCLLSDRCSRCVSRLRWKSEIPTRTHRQEEELCSVTVSRQTHAGSYTTCITRRQLYSGYLHGRMQLINTHTQADAHSVQLCLRWRAHPLQGLAGKIPVVGKESCARTKFTEILIRPKYL